MEGRSTQVDPAQTVARKMLETLEGLSPLEQVTDMVT